MDPNSDFMTALFSEIYNPSSFRTMGHSVIDMLADYAEKVQTDMDYPVLPYHIPDDELKFWQNDFNSDSSILDVFQNVLDRSVHVSHPRYIGHQMASPAFIATLVSPLVDLLNNGSAVYEMGMVGNSMEKVIIDFMTSIIGYDSHSSGFLTSGGTLANFTALLAARKAKAPKNVWKEGQHELKLAVMVSEESHYSIDRAAKILGFGDDGVIKLPVDKQARIKIDALETHLKLSKDKGLHVIAIIGSAATTSTGSYDDFVALSDFAKNNNLWFHIDGAHGGGVVFSKKHRHLAQGIHLADSITIDFHKMLMTPAPSTALLFKDIDDSYDNFQQEAQYVFNSHQTHDWYHSGKRTFECTKLMMSVKIYTVLKVHGKDVFEHNINCLFGLAHSFASLIKQRPSFELAIEPQANIVNFRIVDTDVLDLNVLNNAIRNAIVESGKFYIVQTTIHDKRYLRCTVMNPLTKLTDFELLLDVIEQFALSCKEGLSVSKK